MRTPLRFAGLALAAAVTVALLVVPGLAGASNGGPADTGPAVDLPAQIEPALPATSPVPDPAPATKPAETRSDPGGSVSSPVMPFDPGYWTPERMANAKPMPMPTVP